MFVNTRSESLNNVPINFADHFTKLVSNKLAFPDSVFLCVRAARAPCSLKVVIARVVTNFFSRNLTGLFWLNHKPWFVKFLFFSSSNQSIKENVLNYNLWLHVPSSKSSYNWSMKELSWDFSSSGNCNFSEFLHQVLIELKDKNISLVLKTTSWKLKIKFCTGEILTYV